MVLLILAVIWAAVLVPPWLQNRRENRPSDSIASFRQQLSVLQRATPGHPGTNPRVARFAGDVAVAARHAAMRRAEIRKRRRDVFLTLLGAAAVTLPMAVVLGGPVWMLHLAVDALLLGYVAMLIQLQQRAAEREVKVRYLAKPARAPEPALLLRRSAN